MRKVSLGARQLDDGLSRYALRRVDLERKRDYRVERLKDLVARQLDRRLTALARDPAARPQIERVGRGVDAIDADSELPTESDAAARAGQRDVRPGRQDRADDAQIGRRELERPAGSATVETARTDQTTLLAHGRGSMTI